MKSLRWLLGLAALFALPLQAQAPSVTIYNDGRVLVRRTFPVALPKGVSTQRLTTGALDPASVFPLDQDVRLVRAAFDGGLDQEAALRRSVGRELRFWREKPGDTVRATVLSADPLKLRLGDGSIIFSPPGMALYPADLLPGGPELLLTVDAAQAQRTLGLGYLTQGANWSAGYTVLLGKGGQATVQGAAVIDNGSLDLDSVAVQLLAGNVSRAQPQQGPQPFMARAAAPKESGVIPGEQRSGEFHLYTLPGAVSFRPGVTSVVSLFDPASTGYQKRYQVAGELPWWGGLPQHPDEQDVPVEVTYTLGRPAKSNFGSRPLPGGVARLYQPDSEGRPQLVGEAAVGHTPAGQDLRIAAGTAFDLTARRTQTSYALQRDSSRTTATAAYEVKLANATDSTATVEVLEQRAGDWEVVSSSAPAERTSSTTVRFRVRVPAGGETVLRYRVRVRW